ncbi:MAG: hypothetical protein JJ921_05170 [Pseudomonadales bacterium]|nr:hypothetical protein [Pseudomonadales bacterium]MBO6701709.1 hypothetical protein [Pseudomonadales bacterium]MBO7006647.1 hypothetical protein [Pseudomonadales bacterium]
MKRIVGILVLIACSSSSLAELQAGTHHQVLFDGDEVAFSPMTDNEMASTEGKVGVVGAAIGGAIGLGSALANGSDFQGAVASTALGALSGATGGIASATTGLARAVWGTRSVLTGVAGSQAGYSSN